MGLPSRSPQEWPILDIGATQDIIGLPALQALEDELARSGLQALEVPTTSTAPSGIGGSAKVSKTVLVPISPWRHPRCSTVCGYREQRSPAALCRPS